MIVVTKLYSSSLLGMLHLDKMRCKRSRERELISGISVESHSSYNDPVNWTLLTRTLEFLVILSLNILVLMRAYRK